MSATFETTNKKDEPGAASNDDLQIVELDVDDARVLAFVAAHPESTVYHHPAWLRTLAAEYERSITLLGCQGRDGELIGIFPLMHTRGLSFGGPATRARLSSLPRTPVAGPLSTSREASTMLLQAALERVSGRPGTLLQVKTEGPALDRILDGLTGSPWRQSFILPLSEDPSQLRIGSSGTQRSRIRWAVRKAERMGLRVRIVSSDDDLRSWYRLYLENMRRVMVPPRSLRLFLSMRRVMEPLGLMKMMIAERITEGRRELIAGSIFLMYGKRVFYAFTACPTEHYALRPQDLIQWEAIHWSARNGYREYDFGETPVDNAQLAAFKSKWGGEERTLYRYYYPSRGHGSSESWTLPSYQRILGAAWRRVPLSLTAAIGDLIYSYL